MAALYPNEAGRVIHHALGHDRNVFANVTEIQLGFPTASRY